MSLDAVNAKRLAAALSSSHDLNVAFVLHVDLDPEAVAGADRDENTVTMD
jgi:hypothetical protein